MHSRSTLALTSASIAGLLLCACSTDPSHSSAAGAEQVPVTITGGHDTNSLDNGRPVVLVAALLGVEPEVFRVAFSGVTPAGAGETPEGDQVLSNKDALLSVLGPYGVTNDELDAASNNYRYQVSVGETWAHRDATATATVVGGAITAVTITDPGRGYTSAPTIAISRADGTSVAAHATVTYTAKFDTNGSITSITL